MSSTAVQRFYRYHAHFYDLTRWTILHGRRRAVARLGLRPSGEVLEVGCGTGLNFRHVLEPLDPVAGKLVGLDFSAEMLVKAEQRVAARGWKNIELVQADAAAMDLGRKFDAVFFAYSLTMIPDWEGALARGYEHLKPGGRLVVLDFSTFSRWGPLAPVMRTWLRSSHVLTRRPYLDGLRRHFADLEVSEWFGGYNFTAVGRRVDS